MCFYLLLHWFLRYSTILNEFHHFVYFRSESNLKLFFIYFFCYLLIIWISIVSSPLRVCVSRINRNFMLISLFVVDSLMFISIYHFNKILAHFHWTHIEISSSSLLILSLSLSICFTKFSLTSNSIRIVTNLLFYPLHFHFFNLLISSCFQLVYLQCFCFCVCLVCVLLPITTNNLFFNLIFVLV